MEILSEEMQVLAVEKTIEEMTKAEQNLMEWNVSWFERYENAVLPSGYFYNSHDENERLDKEVSKIDPYTATDEYKGIPLRHLVIGNKYSCDVNTIRWYGIKTNNAQRTIIFRNDGKIKLSKIPSSKIHNKRKHLINYEATYDVLSNDFEIYIDIEKLPRQHFSLSTTEKIVVKLSGNILSRKYNNIEIIDDLNTGLRHIIITKKHDRNNNASIFFEAILNSNNNLEMGALAINTHKGNGKVNGTYRFDASRQKGVRANFYSRKGIKIDLMNNPMLLGTASTLMLPSSNNETQPESMIVSNFANSTQQAIIKNLSNRVITFDSSDFNMDAVLEADNRIIEILKTIKGEIPLDGLVERINYSLSLMSKKKELESPSVKTLKLESNN